MAGKGNRVAEEPAFNEALEREVISLLLSNFQKLIYSAIEQGVTSKSFHTPLYKIAWMVLHKGYADDTVVTALNFESVLLKVEGLDTNVFEEMGGYSFLAELVDSTFTDASWEANIKDLLLYQDYRELRELSIKLQEAVTQRKHNPEKIIGILQVKLGSIQDRTASKSTSYIRSGEFLFHREGLNEKRASHAVDLAFYTPWAGVNDALYIGCTGGTQSILAGRPKMGKSTAKINLLNYWLKSGLGVYSYTPEMGVNRDHDAMLAFRGIPPTHLLHPDLEIEGFKLEELKARVEEYEADLNSLNLVLDGRRGISFRQLIESVRIEKARMPVHIVTIDMVNYLEEGMNANPAARVTVFENLLRQAGKFSAELDVHIMWLWQIRRAADSGRSQRDDSGQVARPNLDQLKSAGAAEEVVDLIMMLHRNNYYEEDSFDNTTELIIQPQRAVGGVGIPKVVNLVYKPYVKLEEYDEGATLMDSEPSF